MHLYLRCGLHKYYVIVIVPAVLGVGHFSTYPQSAHAASACKANSAIQDSAPGSLSQSNHSPIVGSREHRYTFTRVDLAEGTRRLFGFISFVS